MHLHSGRPASSFALLPIASAGAQPIASPGRCQTPPRRERDGTTNAIKKLGYNRFNPDQGMGDAGMFRHLRLRESGNSKSA